MTMYIGQIRYSPIIHKGGIRVSVHKSGSTPLMDEDGFDLSSGTETSISLKTVSYQDLDY